MAQAAGAGHGIEDIYKSVINDVINQVKEAFLDESVDVEVLSQLKKTWEEKVRETGAVDLDGPKPVPIVPLRQPTRDVKGGFASSASHPSSSGTSQQVGQQPNPQVAGGPQIILSQGAQGVQGLQQPGQAANRAVPLTNQQMMMLQQGHAGPGPQYQVVGNQLQFVNPNGQFITQPGLQNLQVIGVNNQGQQQYALLPGNRMVVVPQNQIPISITNPQLLQSIRFQQANQGGQQQPGSSNGNIPQLDGSGDVQLPTSSEKPIRKNCWPKGPPKKFVIQLDGGGPGMTDSSSEEEEEEEEDPLHRYAGLQNDAPDDGEGNDEEPLNSGDDQSDEEDLGTLFDSENVVICQFEKVHRARTKWKFTLKDGIMHLNGKDYCFQKCTGEAEW